MVCAASSAVGIAASGLAFGAVAEASEKALSPTIPHPFNPNATSSIPPKLGCGSGPTPAWFAASPAQLVGNVRKARIKEGWPIALEKRRLSRERLRDGEVAEWFKREATDLPRAGHKAQRS
jgi:hypothetical protein